MIELTRQQRELLAFIAANHERRLIPSRRVRLPRHVSRTVNNLRRAGLLDAASFRPTQDGLAALKLRTPAAPPAAPPEVADERLDAAPWPTVPGGAADAGPDPLPQRPGSGTAQGRAAPLAELAAPAAPDGLGHCRLEAREPVASPADVVPLLPAPAIVRDEAPFRRKPDAQICAEVLAHRAERARMEALRPPLDLESAKSELIRRGRTVYSARVVGGPANRFVVSGLGSRVTGAELLAEAKRVMAGRLKVDP